MLVFDGDYPMAHSGIDANRDLTRSLAEVRATPNGPRDIEEHTGVLATLPEMRRGRVAAALVKLAARLEIFGGPLLASHSNTRAVVRGERQLPDDLIRSIAARDGVVGVTFDAWMLNHRREYDWSLQSPIINERGTADGPITLEDVANHIVHICTLTGSPRHAGIGGDTDGQGGRLSAPAEIESAADFGRVGDVLARRGFDEDAIANVLYRNWRDFYVRNLPS